MSFPHEKKQELYQITGGYHDISSFHVAWGWLRLPKELIMIDSSRLRQSAPWLAGNFFTLKKNNTDLFHLETSYSPVFFELATLDY